MNTLIKYTLLLAVVFAFGLTGCNDLFDKGDTEKAYNGPDVVAFKPLSSEVSEGSSTTIEVQFISSEGLTSSDLTVNFSVGGTADPAHYNIPGGNSVTIPSGSASAEVTINFPADSGLDEGDEETLELTLEGTDDVQAAENLKTTTIFIQGVNE